MTDIGEGRWEDRVRAALGALVGEDPGRPDREGSYALFLWEDGLAHAFWEGVQVADLFGDPTEAPAAWNEGDSAFDLSRFSIDPAGSCFGVESFEVTPALDAAVAAAATGDGRRRVIAASALGRLLAEHAVDPATLRGHDATLLGRVVTDGSLLDALRAATWTHGGPEHLAARDEGLAVDARWSERLDAVADPALRAHLESLCLDEEDARADGALFTGDDWPTGLGGLALAGHTIVAGWEFGEGQAALAVVRLAPRP
jgi:hypothetical protein